ncbi:hypothetical protein AB1L30_06185 [Bremerella sp. JC817]|uniref:hypothetical protein n=1 Tax=Bremerella sp. JC817 TaxID=3231756 RepID=UPI00345969B6
MTEREELLLKMYDQMHRDIHRHILVVWQSVGVVVGAFAIFALVEKNVLPLDLAAGLMVLLCGWLIAHLLDASYWYNRNLVIIANIERQFLAPSDLREIHYYWGRHRESGAMLTHLRIQKYLGIGVATVVLLYHFSVRIYPGFYSTFEFGSFEPIRAVPYLILLVVIVFSFYLRHNRNASYTEFLKNSPGRDVDDRGVFYGVGHRVSSSECDKMRQDGEPPVSGTED